MERWSGACLTSLTFVFSLDAGGQQHTTFSESVEEMEAESSGLDTKGKRLAVFIGLAPLYY